MKVFLLIACLLILPTSSFAVDGYKNLKFGINKEAVKKSKLCKFDEVPSVDGEIGEVLECEDFKFSGITTYAWAYFIDNKFLRLVFNLPEHQGIPVLDALTEKYGKASSFDSTADFESVRLHPNRSAFISFDKDTIRVKMGSTSENMIYYKIFYESPKYEQMLLKNQKMGVKDSL